VTHAHGIAASDTPVLRIVAGDTVHTSTLDAGGWGSGALGAANNKRDRGGNPLVGPIYVENALPGDVLIVKLHRVRLNRAWAFSGTSLMETAIDPSYAAGRESGRQDDKWVLDTVTSTARLAQPSTALADFSVPLHPFLGAIATAVSADHAPSSREAGSFGGNMENKWVREGATVMLPVRVRGAYLYLGDGHAAQGDGQLTGDAMQTSLDVTFSVGIRRWGFKSLVRVEDAEQIMSIGVEGVARRGPSSRYVRHGSVVGAGLQALVHRCGARAGLRGAIRHPRRGRSGSRGHPAGSDIGATADPVASANPAGLAPFMRSPRVPWEANHDISILEDAQGAPGASQATATRCGRPGRWRGTSSSG
jgi:acetamidase/formamidase